MQNKFGGLKVGLGVVRLNLQQISSPDVKQIQLQDYVTERPHQNKSTN